MRDIWLHRLILPRHRRPAVDATWVGPRGRPGAAWAAAVTVAILGRCRGRSTSTPMSAKRRSPRSQGDEPLLDVVTSASVACGFHAGDARRDARHGGGGTAARRGHRSAPFLRRPRRLRPDRHRRTRGPPRRRHRVPDRRAPRHRPGLRRHVRFVKPHGALYNRLWADDALARTVCEAVGVFGDLVLLVGAGSDAATRGGASRRARAPPRPSPIGPTGATAACCHGSTPVP